MSDVNIVNLIGRANHSVQFKTQSESTDATGARIPGTLSNNGAAKIGWVQPGGSSTIESYGRRMIGVSHSIYLSEDPSVNEGDVATYDGRDFLVKGIINPAELGRFWRVDVEEVL